MVCVMAERMTAGRGRRGRAWKTFDGCQLLLTFILKEGVGAHLPLVVSLLAQQVLTAVTGLKIDVKWPNDLLIDGQKITGILIEKIGDAALLGIGINVNTPQHGLPEDFVGTTLQAAFGEMISREDVLNKLAQHLEDGLKVYETQGWSAFQEAYATACITLNQRVIWREGDKEICGTAVQLNSDGALELREDMGAVHIIHSGDVVAQGREHSA